VVICTGCIGNYKFKEMMGINHIKLHVYNIVISTNKNAIN